MVNRTDVLQLKHILPAISNCMLHQIKICNNFCINKWKHISASEMFSFLMVGTIDNGQWMHTVILPGGR